MTTTTIVPRPSSSKPIKALLALASLSCSVLSAQSSNYNSNNRGSHRTAPDERYDPDRRRQPAPQRQYPQSSSSPNRWDPPSRPNGGEDRPNRYAENVPPPPPPDSSDPRDPQSQWREPTANFGQSAPISYSFKENSRRDGGEDDTEDDMKPVFTDEEEEEEEGTRRGGDLMRRYRSTRKGRSMVTLSCALIGAGIGTFIGKSISVLPPLTTGVITSALFLILSLPKNSNASAYSTLVQSLGLLLLLVIREFQSTRKEYPTAVHVKALLKMRPREEFTSSSNKIEMMVAMFFVGAVCGGNLPLVPTSLGGVIGAALLCFGCTLQDPKGDLLRTMGMRLVSLFQYSLELLSDLGIWSQFSIVLGMIWDKFMILDRKHKIKDRLAQIVQWFYENVIKRVMKDVKEDVEEKQEGGNENFDRKSAGERDFNDDRRRPEGDYSGQQSRGREGGYDDRRDMRREREGGYDDRRDTRRDDQNYGRRGEDKREGDYDDREERRRR